eukprot:GILJ01016859.1.p1 GENE.GILJ01016859.1~~GILJ01016859.1.p1  ORF type:complete len:671 (+),score=67.32 GILJ01016859.1:135-2147(+)
MKFAKTLAKLERREWIDKYLNYSSFKRQLKQISRLHQILNPDNEDNQHAKADREARLQEQMKELEQAEKEFLTFLQKELVKVDSFYAEKEDELMGRAARFANEVHLLLQREPEFNDKDIYAIKAGLEASVIEFQKDALALKDFSMLNASGFTKIIKKHDKGVKLPQFLLKSFGNQVRACPFLDISNLEDIMTKTQNLFIELFAQGDRQKGMSKIRSAVGDGSATNRADIFFFGFFVGTCLSVTLWIIALCRQYDVDFRDDNHLKSVFPVFRGIGYLCIYIWGLAINFEIFKLTGINYRYMFGLRSGGSDHFLRQTGFMTLCFLFGFVWFLGQYTGAVYLFQLPEQYIPLIVLSLFVIFLLFPGRCFHGEGRIIGWKSLLRVISAPLLPVCFLDNFVGDQLTSAVKYLGDLEYTVCYYSTNAFRKEKYSPCFQFQYQYIALVAFLPYWFRMMQCFRRYRDSVATGADRTHLINAGKYFSALLVIATDALSLVPSSPDSPKLTGWRIAWIGLAFISTVYAYLWDILMDWGLFHRQSKLPCLRETLLYKKTWFYYWAMASNMLLRFSWVLTISPNLFGIDLAPNVFTFMVGVGEIFRRVQWNLIRMEYEHIMNLNRFHRVDFVPVDGHTVDLPPNPLERLGDFVSYIKKWCRRKVFKSRSSSSSSRRVFFSIP